MENDQFNTTSQLKSDLDPQEMLRVIFDYAAKIANERILDNVLMLMADMGREMIVSDRCTVWLLDTNKNELWSKVAHGLDEIRIPSTAGLVGYAVTNDKAVFIHDAYSNEEYKSYLLNGALRTDQQTGYRTKALMVIPFRNSQGEIMGAYQAINKLTASEQFSDKDMEYLTLASSYAGKSLESALLTNEIEETQKEIIFRMGEIGESRSKETGNHVKRVAEYSYLLALGLGMSQEEAELLKMASPMHDIGKVAIPDSILTKPGKLTDEEFKLMQNHTRIGYNLLKNSNRHILKTAAVVAYEHHEKWNGRGYPRGIKGEEIHIYGRITAIADVFDALGSERVYKKAWELDRILQLFKEEQGEHFDPKVVDAFFQQLPSILQVRDQYSDAALEDPTEV
ncbi:HD domain-containing protein [Paenibacillus alginolyticus]|uniref:HD domain-containing protein n=1 Tax=Paenibacillus alginolyticus TaxID=59839 RepID=A0ABT4GBJ0_9BACL|nr:HD domain-containing phosphohydrolase [Paenibacillus alginolyticus]MCY9664076.1 HD domain-containing protein [Paenibacillus alginolyticus]MCY9693556.1 HD domain-containing protein [Paenibacillus alginolyticus]MEC0144411.1 HD domain-containing protein [Paenibacillus alginolyticus]